MKHETTATSEKKQKNHLFKKGKSGNPAGRPHGCRNKATILLQGMIDGQGEALVQKAIDLALDGDAQTLRALIDKLVPNRKEAPVNLQFPEIEGSKGISKLTSAVLEAVGNGELTPGEAAGISKLVDVHVRSLELTEMDERLTKLEQVIKEKKP